MSWRRGSLARREDKNGGSQKFIEWLDKVDPKRIQQIADDVADSIRNLGHSAAEGLAKWQGRRRRR